MDNKMFYCKLFSALKLKIKFMLFQQKTKILSPLKASSTSMLLPFKTCDMIFQDPKPLATFIQEFVVYNTEPPKMDQFYSNCFNARTQQNKPS